MKFAVYACVKQEVSKRAVHKLGDIYTHLAFELIFLCLHAVSASVRDRKECVD